MIKRRVVVLGSLGVAASGMAAAASLPAHWRRAAVQILTDSHPRPPELATASFSIDTSWAKKLVSAALGQIGQTVTYDPAYVKLAYPGGDVPFDRGVCTDVVVRAYRTGLGFDLQRAVHEDMVAHFAAYPRNWGLSHPDRNIDHRRVPNLQTFFTRQGAKLSDASFRPGDLVTMKLPGNLPHIGLVTAHASEDGSRPLLVHNIGAGARLEDVLGDYPLTGHYRFNPGSA